MLILVCNKTLWCSIYLINTNCKKMANTLGSRLKKCLTSTSTPLRFVILLKKDVEEKENSLGLKLKRVLVLPHVYGVLPFSWRKMSKKKQNIEYCLHFSLFVTFSACETNVSASLSGKIYMGISHEKIRNHVDWLIDHAFKIKRK